MQFLHRVFLTLSLAICGAIVPFSARAGEVGTAVPPVTLAPAAAVPDREVVAELAYGDEATLHRMAERLDVWTVDRDRGVALVRLLPEEWAFVRGLGVEPRIDAVRSGELRDVATLGIPGYPSYRTVAELESAQASLAATHPTLVVTNTIGVSWDKATAGGPAGHDIRLLVLGNRTNSPASRFRFLLIGGIHGRELTAPELAMRFVEELAGGYGTDPDATWLLDYGELHAVVVSNPDGHLKAEGGASWRKNTDSDDGCTDPNKWGVDLNRNFSFRWGVAGTSTDPSNINYRGPSPTSEPETVALENYMAAIFPDQRGPGDDDAAPADATGAMVSLHSFSQLVLCPWGSTDVPTPNATGLYTLGCKFGYFNRYKVGPTTMLYPTSGSAEEHAYGTLGIAAYVFELGTKYFQDCAFFESSILTNNLRALRYAFKAARRPYQTPAGPEVTALALTPAMVAPGGAVTVAGLADDTRVYSGGGVAVPVAQTIAAARAHVGAPSWEGGFPLALTVTGAVATVRGFTGTLDTSGLQAGRHLVFVEAQDAAGNWGVPTAAFLEVSEAGAQTPPVAADDSVSTDQDVPVVVDVLANDHDPNFDPLTVAWVQSPATNAAGASLGTVEINTPATDVTFTPGAGANGVAFFDYAVSDGTSSDTGRVTVVVASVEPPPPPPPAWPRSLRIVFTGYDLGETLADFPALVRFSEGENGFRHGDLASPQDGADLRFTASDGVTELSYEIERWTPDGDSWVWVRVPALAGPDTCIWAHYGRTGLTPPPCTTNGATWGNGYLAVYHFGETAGPVVDATAWHHDGNVVGGVARSQPGIAGLAYGFDGDGDYVEVTDANRLDGMAALTLEVWKVDRKSGSGTQAYLAKRLDINNSAYDLYRYGADFKLRGGVNQSRKAFGNSATTPNTGWHYQVLTFNAALASGELKAYVDGLFADQANCGDATVPDRPEPLLIGRLAGGAVGTDMEGLLDEVRLSSVARSPNWIRATWLTMAANAAFTTYEPPIAHAPAGTVLFVR